MEDKGKSILKMYSQLCTARQPFEENWEQAFQYSYPLRGQRFSGGSEDGNSIQSGANQDKSKLYDTTGKDAARLLASSMLSGLTPPNMQWFNLTLPSAIRKAMQEQNADVKQATEWLQAASKTMFEMIHSSNYDAEAFEFMLDLVIGGMCGLYVEMAEQGGLMFEFWPLEAMWVKDTRGYGKIDTVVRRLMYTSSQAAEKFGDANLPDAMKNEYKNDPSACKQHPIIHVIRPRMVGRKQADGKLNKNLPFESIYVCGKSGKVLKESGFHEMPVIVPRWHKIPNTEYAVGPYDDALPDVKTINYMVRLILTNADMKVSGMWVAKNDGVINPNTFRIGPKRVIMAMDPNNIKPLSPGGDFQVAVAELTRLERNIRRVLMSDQLQPQDGPAMTATEVHVRTMLVRQLLGPVYGRLSAEFLQPLIERVFGLLYRAGFFGPIPEVLNGVEFTPEYSSPLARAQKMEDVQAMDQFEGAMAQAAQIKPEILDLYDFDKAAKTRAGLLGVPEHLFKTDREVKKIRDDRQKQMEQAQQMAMMQQMQQGQG